MFYIYPKRLRLHYEKRRKKPNRAKVKSNREKLIKTLEKGSYNKGTGVLRDKDDNFCCIGVMADIIGLSCKIDDSSHYYLYEGNCSLAPKQVMEEFALYTPSGGNEKQTKTLTGINDNSKTWKPVINALKTGKYWKALLNI